MLLRGAVVLLALDLARVRGEYSRDQAFAFLRGRHLRVTFTTIEDPYIFKQNGQWTGVLKDFLDELTKEVGFTYSEHPVSEESLNVTRSSNTGCARDVNLSITDLCVGNSWVTTQRLGYAKVLPTLWFETLQLGVNQTLGSGSIWFEMLQAFKPFDAVVWLSIVLVIILYAFFIWYAEHAENDADYPDKDPLVSGSTSLYHGFFGFVWSDPPTQPVTAEGRILALGFGFFTLIMMSSYTASLASVLVATNKQPEFQDLQDAINQGATVCMWLSVLPRAQKLYPDLREPLAKNMGGSYEDGYNRVANGECQVILADSIFHAKAQERNERDCDMTLVGGPVVDINCAWFAVDWLVGPMSIVMTDLMAKGVLADLKRVYSPRVLCADEEVGTGLSPGQVSGVLFITGGFLLITGTMHFCRKGFRHGRQSGALQRLSLRKSQTSIPEVKIIQADAIPDNPGSPAANMEKIGSGDTEAAVVTKDSGMDGLPMANRASHRRSTASSMQSALKRAARRLATNGSKPSIDRNSPGYAVVHEFRKEKQLSELPFVKALLIMAEVQGKANHSMLRTLQRLRRTDEPGNSAEA